MSAEIGKMLNVSKNNYALKNNKIINIITGVMVVTAFVIAVGIGAAFTYMPNVSGPLGLLLIPAWILLAFAPFAAFALVVNVTERLVYNKPLGKAALEERQRFFDDLTTYTQNAYGLEIPESAQDNILRNQVFQATTQDGVVANLSFKSGENQEWLLFSGNKEIQRVS